MYKQNLALNNQQWLICHKTKPNQTSSCIVYDSASTKSVLFKVSQYSSSVLLRESPRNLAETKRQRRNLTMTTTRLGCSYQKREKLKQLVKEKSHSIYCRGNNFNEDDQEKINSFSNHNPWLQPINFLTFCCSIIDDYAVFFFVRRFQYHFTITQHS